jgi:acyl-coenzyme A thioesterase 13
MGSDAWMADAARRWLEDAGATVEGGPDRAFNALPLSGVRVSLAERGRAVCSLRVPAHLTVSSFAPPVVYSFFFLLSPS